MVPLSVVACAALFALASATEVKQCSGKPEIEGLRENVQLSPCKKTPCKLKKGTNQNIVVTFTPATDVKTVTNHVTAEVVGVPLPFIGVDGLPICGKIYSEDGEKVSCPLKAGTKYQYKDSFPVLEFYPSISVLVNWRLTDEKEKDLTCFEVPARITN